MAKNSSQVRAQNKKTLVKRIRSRWQLYLLLLLPLAWLIIFAYVPMGGLVIAFKKYNVRQGIWESEWVGLKNFEKFFKSVKFPVVMRNTLTVSLYSLVVTFPIPIIFALLLNAMPGRRYKKVIQTVTYIPYFISTVVMVGLIFQVLDYRNGLWGSLFSLFTGKTAPNILANGKLFKHIYVWSAVWQTTGYSAIIYIAALAGVDQSLHEAAMIDGCSPLQVFFKILIPILKPTIISTAILELMWVWNDYLLPTLVLDIKKYKTIPMAIQYFRGSYGHVQMGPMMASIMIDIIPIIVVYLVCQKYIIEGVVAGAVKG